MLRKGGGGLRWGGAPYLFGDEYDSRLLMTIGRLGLRPWEMVSLFLFLPQGSNGFSMEVRREGVKTKRAAMDLDVFN